MDKQTDGRKQVTRVLYGQTDRHTADCHSVTFSDSSPDPGTRDVGVISSSPIVSSSIIASGRCLLSIFTRWLSITFAVFPFTSFIVAQLQLLLLLHTCIPYGLDQLLPLLRWHACCRFWRFSAFSLCSTYVHSIHSSIQSACGCCLCCVAGYCCYTAPLPSSCTRRPSTHTITWLSGTAHTGLLFYRGSYSSVHTLGYCLHFVVSFSPHSSSAFALPFLTLWPCCVVFNSNAGAFV